MMATSTSFSASTAASSHTSDFQRHASTAFLAGDDAIHVVPLFTYSKPLSLLCSNSIGPFTAGVECAVPIWLALYLHQRSLVRLVAPKWCDTEFLQRILRFEQEQENFSDDLPFHYQVLSRMLLPVLTRASAIPEAVHILLTDIEAVRADKIRKNLHQLSASTLTQNATLPLIEITGVGSLEICMIQSFVNQAFSDHLLLSRKTQDPSHKAQTKSAREEAFRTPRSDPGDEDEDLEEPTPATTTTSTSKSRLRRFR